MPNQHSYQPGDSRIWPNDDAFDIVTSITLLLTELLPDGTQTATLQEEQQLYQANMI